MDRRGWSITGGVVAVLLALSACGSGGEDAPLPEPRAMQEAAANPLPVMGPERRILAFGDSLFAGYGLQDGESYPARLEAALRARGINARVTNAGVSGDTTQAGRQRLSFVLENDAAAPDLAIVELGGNDLLRGLPPEQTRENLAAILAELQRRKIPVLLMGMRAPPNLGADYQRDFDALYPALAKQYGADLVPFFLAAIYDQPRLIQQDHVHPTAEGVSTLVGATVDQVAAAIPPAGE
ncbi:arylesterase [Altererythrobacter sp. B11]|uniref:arylesterase n=1 Tax=Altererythrobacter sp. B11 TaxID=2060312 RepID=UPI000DC703B1|nr:arylesterase [Altererythrobacter sp. B11]BBC74082.1 arylesterase [Altererythrobacter sp. B11]